MKRVILAFAATLAANITLADDIVIDVTKIVGKEKPEVASYLGTPASCGKSKYGEKYYYRKGETGIVYIDGKADWITVENIDHIPFSSSALSALGLKEQKPTFKNDFTLRWENINGMRVISVFKGSSKSDYAYIKVNTK